MNIVFYETEIEEAKYLSKRLPGHEVVYHEAPLTVKNLPDSNVSIISVSIKSQLTSELLEMLPSVKFINTFSTGVDHIDIGKAKARNILVSNVPGQNVQSVAEFTFALLLLLSRKLFSSIKRVKDEGKFSTEGLTGFDLKGKTIGVVGVGQVGLAVIRIAKAFGMNVLAYSRKVNENIAEEYSVSFVSLPELLKKSDVVTLHLSYGPETHHIVNLENISDFKKGSILINTARGGLVETSSILKGLEAGILAGAALDVLEEEGFIGEEAELLLNGHPKEKQLKALLADHALMHMDNVIITPHNAFNSKESNVAMLDATIANIHGFINNQPIHKIS